MIQASVHSLLPSAPPPAGETFEIAPGILWARLPLPMRLDHVNVYALADDDGWTLVDAGFCDEATRGVWDALLTGPLAGRPVRRLIVTHHHPDHVGAAGWLLARTGARLMMTREEFLLTLLRWQVADDKGTRAEIEHFRPHGLPPKVLERIEQRDQYFRDMFSTMPAQFDALRERDTIRLAGREWIVLVGRGHAPAQLMLYSAEDALFLAADQVLGTITPNIPASYLEPNGDPVSNFQASLADLKTRLGAGSLVLPGHKLPFLGVYDRIDALIAHHEQTLDRIVAFCSEQPSSVADLTGRLYRPGLNAGGYLLAASEVLAHLMALRHRGQVHATTGKNAEIFWQSL